MSEPALVDTFAGRSVAVYGGTGLVGGALAARLAELCSPGQGGPVYAIARRAPARAVAGVTYVRASVLDEEEMAAVPRADLAVFVAGATGDYLDNPRCTVEVAALGFQRFLRHTAGATRRLLVGSARVYGPRADATPLREGDECRLRSPDPRNVYDGAKLVAEALARLASTSDRPVVVARLGNVYGPSLGRPPATAFTAFVAAALRSRRVVVSGPPGSLRNHVDARDVAEGLVRALLLGRPGEAYNVGSRDHLTNEDFARRIAAAMPYPVAVEIARPDAPADHMVISIDKAVAELGFTPALRIDEHLPLAVRWELEHHT